TYTGGGMGFAFWFQHGGWDFYSARQYTPTDPTYIFGAEQVSGGATWKAAEDTAITSQPIDENVRLRFSIQNSGAQITGQQFRLQVASKGASLNCESVPHVNFDDVPTTSSGCGSSEACMTATTQFTDQASAADLLSYPASMLYTVGKMVEDPSNETSSMTVNGNNATEVEYNFELTSNAVDSTYCFRSTDGGLALDNYNRVATVSLLHRPVISSFSLNHDSAIALTEGATTTISATSTVTDLNGYADLASATTTIYRSGVGYMCAANENNCYQVASTSCAFSSCSGNACTLTCSADLEYFSDPTDIGTVYAAENWLASVQVEDQTGSDDTDTSLGVELQ
ncbi:MAG: hypothetical protein ABL865_05490, partial [Candidatus Nitrotoga sp.]